MVYFLRDVRGILCISKEALKALTEGFIHQVEKYVHDNNDDKIKISLWNLPEADLFLEAVVSVWQFAERQVMLPLLDELLNFCYTHRIEIPNFLAA
jgi:hypothetical protein